MRSIVIHITILLLAFCPSSIYALKEKTTSAIILKAKGDACYNAGRFSDALEYYTTGMSKAKEEDDNATYYACIGNIGNIYSGMGDYKRALHYYLKGYAAFDKTHDNQKKWGMATNIVAVYSLLGDARNAKAFFDQQTHIPIANQLMRRYYFLNNQALVSQAEKNMSMAEYYFQQALDFAQERNMPSIYKISLMLQLGKMQLEKGAPAKAITYFYEARDSARTAGQKDMLVDIYKSLESAYEKTGRPDSARKYHGLYLALSDSVFNLSQLNMANSKLFEYENAENTKRINSLVSRNYIQLAIIALFVLLAAALAFLYSALRKKNKVLLDAQRLLVTKNEELMKSNTKSKQLLEQYVSMADNQSGEDGGKTPEAPESESKKDDREGFALDKMQKSRLLNSIIHVMEKAEVISQSDFNLNTLASMVGSNTKYVSYVINDTYNKNFRSLLNEYRISEACKRLSDREHYGNMTIQAISEEVGFNSAASFIQAFKRTNGMTPSMYQKLAAQGENNAG